jgi:uncharacterized protein
MSMTHPTPTSDTPPRSSPSSSLPRREFLRRGGVALGSALAGIAPLSLGSGPGPTDPGIQRTAASWPAGRRGAHRRRQYGSRRPPPAKRRFSSPVIEAVIRRISADIGDSQLAWLFSNCFPDTLDTTVEPGTLDGRPDTFVITGDIDAMWLRDSSAQMWPYLPFAREDPGLARLLAGVINRQTRCILIDPYANAFNRGPTGSEWDKDLTEMKPELHERKWEVDSLCYPIRLAHGYWRATGDVAPFDDAWREAMRSVVRTFREQQRKHGHGPYHFQRVTAWQSDTVAGGGYGNPVRPVGLICSVFRPSDDATIYLFLVPSNLFAVASLRQLAELSRQVSRDEAFARECDALADEVHAALQAWGVVEHLQAGRIWAYEVDGYGNRLFMDDANVPSLLAAPYLGSCAPDDPVYRRTRAFVLGPWNPYFFHGTAGEGVGSAHTGMGQIWPLSLIMRAMTSDDDAEIRAALRTLRDTHAGTGFMHESFDKDDPSRFTRKWFAWANTLFGELVLKLHRERPWVLRGTE